MPKYVYLADVDESGELIYSTSVPGKSRCPRVRPPLSQSDVRRVSIPPRQKYPSTETSDLLR